MTPVNKTPLASSVGIDKHPDDPGINFDPLPMSWQGRLVVWSGMVGMAVILAIVLVLVIRWFPKCSTVGLSAAILSAFYRMVWLTEGKR